MTPRVTVIVPTHRRAELLEHTLASVAAQTVPDWECLVVEDGDDPATRDLLARIRGQDSRFHHHTLAHAGLPGRTRNVGIRLARSAFCAFLDDDDLWLPQKLERQLDWVSKHPAVGVVCSRIEEFGAREALWPAGPVPENLEFLRLVRGNLVATSTAFVRTELLRALGGFSEELPRAQDYDLWLRCVREAPVHFQDEVLCRYRTHSGNISGDRLKSLECIERILLRVHSESALPEALLHDRLAQIHTERARSASGWRAKLGGRARAARARALSLFARARGA